MNTVKFAVFADIHHDPEQFCSMADRKLPQILQHAKETNCDFVIHAGDFTHNQVDYMDFIDTYNNFEIPCYHCFGNHDTDHSGFDIAMKAYRMKNNYYYFDVKGFRMVVMDLNYYYENGEYVHFDLGNYFREDLDNRGLMPPDEIEWFKKALYDSPYPCMLISHQSLDRAVEHIINADEVLGIIDEANRRKKNKVMLVMNGHTHIDYLHLLNNVLYFEINSCGYDWTAEPHHCYPKEYEEKYYWMHQTLNFNEPLHAIVTLTDEGEIKIEGMKGSYFLGVDREKSGNLPYDTDGRKATPDISSAHIALL